MQLDALGFREVLLLEFQLRCQVEEAHLSFFFRHDVIQERQMIAEETDGRSVVNRNILPDKLLVEDRSHGRYVFMAETQIDARETRIAGLYSFNPNLAISLHHMSCENLLRQRHRPLLGRNRRQEYSSLHARHIERK